MTSLFFDTNALIYWSDSNALAHSEAKALVNKAVSENTKIYALSSTLNETYYVLSRHYLSKEQAREAIGDIADVFDLVDLTTPMVFLALNSDEPDYEDALVRVAAEALQVEAIVSYDQSAFKGSPIPKITSKQALETFY